MAAFGCGQVDFLTELEVFANLIFCMNNFQSCRLQHKFFTPGESFFLLLLTCGSLLGYNSQTLH